MAIKINIEEMDTITKIAYGTGYKEGAMESDIRGFFEIIGLFSAYSEEIMNKVNVVYWYKAGYREGVIGRNSTAV
jgi:hypothetical protein